MSSERVEKLLSELTLNEKISLLAGQNFWETVPIPRLNIPSLKTSDGPNGARGGTFVGGTTAACFPASVSLAAGFDEDAALEIGKALAEETMTKGAKVILAPTVCPHRSPLGGRNFESFSEDPLLAGRLASSYIKGVQSMGVAATIKHFAGNEQETRRFTMNANIGERALREIYLKPFEIAIKTSNPLCVMTSYNCVNGKHADLNEFLLQRVLRKEWGWDGLVMSDWGGTNSTSESITAGTDLEMPGPTVRRKVDDVQSALSKGTLQESAINKSVRAVLRLVEQCGKFENPETPDEQAIDLPKHRSLIRKIGAQGIVLLKNENNILPLDSQKIKSIAAVGLAKEALAHGGGSAAVNSHYQISPWDALKTKLGDTFDLRYAQGAHTLRLLPGWVENMINNEGGPGFTVSYFSTADIANKKPFKTSVNTDGKFQPIGEEIAAVTVEGSYRSPADGFRYISFGGLGPTKIYINNELVNEQKDNCPDIMGFLLGGAEEITFKHYFRKDVSTNVRLESVLPTSDDPNMPSMLNGFLGTRIGSKSAEDHDRDLVVDAIAVAKDADVALVFVGNTPEWETEGQDMTTMNLPANGSQDVLIREICKVNKNVVVVNSTGVPIAMPWLSSVSGLVQAWFGGQEAGNSIVDILFGDINPSGKLPVTFGKELKDTPAYANFPGDVDKLQVHYEEGIYMGYRHYDKHVQTIQFPFGFGLSYTSFRISNLSLSSKVLIERGSITATVQVENTGSMTGSEVIQVYVSAPGVKIDVPVKVLAGYKKVPLQVGEKKEIEIVIDYQSLASWIVKDDIWRVDAGDYKVSVGSSSQDIAEVGSFEVEQDFVYGA